MTLSIFEFGDVDEVAGEPLWDTLVRRRTGLALTNTYHQIGETGSVRAFIIHNDDGTTPVLVRFHTASSGANADQGDFIIGANSQSTFHIRRKTRSETNNDFYVNAVADT